jgi:hypothetical protein
MVIFGYKLFGFVIIASGSRSISREVQSGTACTSPEPIQEDVFPRTNIWTGDSLEKRQPYKFPCDVEV